MNNDKRPSSSIGLLTLLICISRVISFQPFGPRDAGACLSPKIDYKSGNYECHHLP